LLGMAGLGAAMTGRRRFAALHLAQKMGQFHAMR